MNSKQTYPPPLWCNGMFTSLQFPLNTFRSSRKIDMIVRGVPSANKVIVWFWGLDFLSTLFLFLTPNIHIIISTVRTSVETNYAMTSSPESFERGDAVSSPTTRSSNSHPKFERISLLYIYTRALTNIDLDLSPLERVSKTKTCSFIRQPTIKSLLLL